jgi:hypothetical protein
MWTWFVSVNKRARHYTECRNKRFAKYLISHFRNAAKFGIIVIAPEETLPHI